jgi:hypothetical protein
VLERINAGRVRNALVCLLLAAVCCGLLSCSLGVLSRKLIRQKVNVSIFTDERANLGNPIAVDILLLFNEEAESKLMELTARQWVEYKKQFTLDYREDLDYLMWEFEPVPGVDITDVELPLTVTGEAFIVFANYYTAGEHRVRIAPRRSFVIRLHEREFSVEVVD